MIRVKTKVEGFEASVRHMRRLPDVARAGIEEAVVIEGEVILQRAEGFVPVETGALRDSGRVEDPVHERYRVSVDVVFGNQEVQYAWVVHEDMQTRREDGIAKYLEMPAVQEFSPGHQRFSQTVARRLRSG